MFFLGFYSNKKAEARNQLEIDEETGLKTTIEKTKAGNSKTTNNSNEPSPFLIVLSLS
jgi:hypothetical protein